MKKLSTILCCLFGIFQVAAQWNPTNVFTITNDGIYDLINYNGTLFASVNTDGFVKSTDNGNTWSIVGQTGFTTNPNSLRVSNIASTSSSIYTVTFNASDAASIIYKSIDNGQTFTQDIAGLPTFGSGVETVNNLYAHNDYLIATFNGGNYIKFDSSL